jgi:hypothetical protein
LLREAVKVTWRMPKQVGAGWPTIAGCDSVLSFDSGDGAWLANLR